MKIWQIIFLVPMVSQRVQSQSRLVVNTTCLELARPSNQQFRLNCRQYHDYHCLLDETFTEEFEVCREWKWIPGGKCAYFNTYGSGNVDERECEPRINLTCSNSQQFESNRNTQFTACYAKRESVTPSSTSTSNSAQATLNQTSDEDAEIPPLTSESWYALPIVMGIIAPLLSLSLIYSICIRLEATKKECTKSKDVERDDARYGSAEKKTLLKQKEIFLKNLPTQRHYNEASQTGANKDKNNLDTSSLSDSSEDSFSSLPNTTPTDSKFETGKNRQVEEEEKLVEFTSGSCFDSEKFENEKGDEKTLTDVFDDILESLQRKTSAADKQGREMCEKLFNLLEINGRKLSRDVLTTVITNKQGREMCEKLFNLLEINGRKLSRDVLTTVITSKTGKPVKRLINDLTDEEKNKLRGILPEESHRILKDEAENDTSFHVLYGLHRIYLDKKHHPKLGCSNPVNETNIDIGDDLERLNKIETIVRKISNPETVSVESYIMLLSILREILSRLDFDNKFNEDLEALSNTYIIEILEQKRNKEAITII